jgi:Fur family transcriptional regulator, peroxide stress response regulator
MCNIFEDLKNKLKENNIRLSHQRLKILEYIYDNFNHPTVDEIYNDLHEEIPTLSKTTIYNTLNTLVDVNLVKVLNIENNETRYDPTINDHGHFKCEKCKKIFDFNLNFDSLDIKELDGFEIHKRDLYFKGICPTCVGKNK